MRSARRLGRFAASATVLLAARPAVAQPKPEPEVPAAAETAPSTQQPPPESPPPPPSTSETAPTPPEIAPPPEAAEPRADKPAPQAKEQIEVYVIGDRADALQKIPGSGDLVTREQLKRAQPSDVGEMLRRVPGVQVRQEYGGGMRLDISVRGLEGGRSRRVLLLEDGIPISLNPYAEPDMYYGPPVERMRGIEVVKGSGSILFGPQTIGGVVNFLTLMPDEKRRAAVDVEGGQLGYFRGLGMFSDHFGSVRYLGQALFRRGNGFRDEQFEQIDTLAKVALETSSTGEAILKLGFHDDWADSDAVGLTREMYERTPRRGTLAPNDRMHLRRYDASVTHLEKLGPSTSLKTLLYGYITDRIWRRQDYVRNRAPGASYRYVVGDEAIPYGAIYFENTNTILDRSYAVAGVEPRFEHRFVTGGVGHTLDFGVRFLGELASYQQRAGDTPTSWAGQLDNAETHRTLALAAYVQDRMAFREWLLVTPGVRVEHPEYHREILRQGGTDVDIEGDSSVTGVIPGIGMIAGTRQNHVFGGLHVGWAPPRIVSSISPRGEPAEVGSERSLNYEVGTRLRPIPWLGGSLTGFLTNFDNQVVINTAAGGEGAELTDAGRTRLYGAEVSSIVELGRALRLGLILDVGARYTYSRATFEQGDDEGNLLPYAPLHTASMNLDVEEPHGVGGQIAYNIVGPQFSDAANTEAEDTTGRIGELPTRHVVDATVHYRHKASGLSARVTVKNVLDDVYIIARRPEGIHVSGFRQVIAGLRWDYEAASEERPAE